MVMWKFTNKYCNGDGVQIEVESCGVADIIWQPV